MTQRAAVTAAASIYDDMPFMLVLFRFVWPFWLFSDASRGDRHARAAAYRHNRNMRIHLPGYLMKWLLACGLALATTRGLETLAMQAGPAATTFSLLAALCGVMFACGICVLCVTGYVYLYLDRNDS